MSALILRWRAIEPGLTVGFVPQPTGASIPAAIIGPPGRDGNGVGAGTVHEHVQSEPVMLWRIRHDLGREPLVVSCLTDEGNTLIGNVTLSSSTETHIAFLLPMSGRARLF